MHPLSSFSFLFLPSLSFESFLLCHCCLHLFGAQGKKQKKKTKKNKIKKTVHITQEAYVNNQCSFLHERNIMADNSAHSAQTQPQFHHCWTCKINIIVISIIIAAQLDYYVIVQTSSTSSDLYCQETSCYCHRIESHSFLPYSKYKEKIPLRQLPPHHKN